MPSRFCDQEDACPTLKKAAKSLLSPDFSGKGFEVIIKGRDGVEHRVFLEYCPFCGTRIDSRFVETLRPKR